MIERRAYQSRPERFDHLLAYPARGGPPLIVEHSDCGGDVDGHRICARCGARLGPGDVTARPGPGAGATAPAS